MAFGRRRRRLSAFKGGRFNLRRLTPRRKARIERRRRKFFEEDLEFDKKSDDLNCLLLKASKSRSSLKI